MALISCDNLSLAYESKTIVSELTFSVNKGDYLCIVGENGSGKSTLMRTLLGLKSPASGTLTFGDGLLKNEIGYLPQQTDVQRDFPASVKEVVISGCLARTGLRPFYGKAEKKLAQDAMEEMGITDLAKRSYRELSGGQQQRVLLARALCATRKLLILDEPVAGLDPKVTQDMYGVIDRLNKESGITIIMVSHDILQAVNYASHILHLSSKPLFFGKTEDYLKSGAGRMFTGIDFHEKGEGGK
ncbi:MAG: ABC transporter ATP-binding protein [Clostridiales bacterium]|nr:ABC transporter ATP-binding protein [Clostridiales bacterium]MCD7827355.1 ABC transporter ATP-binding protein [Clostridiales bacterium]